MKHSNTALYSIDHLNTSITVSKSFLKQSGIIGSDAYQEMLRLRQELPEYTMEVQEARKHHRTKIGSNLNYKKMRDYIAVKEGKDSPMLKELDRVMDLAKVQRNPLPVYQDLVPGPLQG